MLHNSTTVGKLGPLNMPNVKYVLELTVFYVRFSVSQLTHSICFIFSVEFTVLSFYVQIEFQLQLHFE